MRHFAPKSIEVRSFAFSSIFVLFYLSFLIRIMHNDSIIYPLITFIIALCSFPFVFSLQRTGKKAFLVCFAFLLCMLTSYIYNRNHRYVELLYFIQNMGLALALLKVKLNYKVMTVSFWAHFSFFLFHILLNYNPEALFVGQSRNTISALILLHVILLYIATDAHGRRMSILPVAAATCICIWAIGRNGILCSIILLIFTTYYNATALRLRLLRILAFAFSISFFVFIAIMLVNSSISTLLFSSEALDKFQKDGIESLGRLAIWSEYLQNCDLNYFSYLLGSPIKNNALFDYFYFNLHSSYFHAHAYYGLTFLFILLFLIINSFLSFHKEAKALYIALLCVILLRGSTDALMFNGIYDPLVYFFLLHPLVISPAMRHSGRLTATQHNNERPHFKANHHQPAIHMFNN